MRKKSKSFTQLSGREEDYLWIIGLRVKEDGKIQERYSIKLYSYEENRKSNRKDYYKHHEKRLQDKRDYYATHQDIVKEQVKNCYEKHKEQYLAKRYEWHKNNLQKSYGYRKKYYRSHREEHIIRNREWQKNNPEKMRVHWKRERDKRRNMGFNPLNEILDGIECEAHHINKEDVIYIPAIIHRRIKHSLKNNKNMEIINSIAYTFL